MRNKGKTLEIPFWKEEEKKVLVDSFPKLGFVILF